GKLQALSKPTSSKAGDFLPSSLAPQCRSSDCSASARLSGVPDSSLVLRGCSRLMLLSACYRGLFQTCTCSVLLNPIGGCLSIDRQPETTIGADSQADAAT